jgi:hypothetical protein
MTVDVPFGGPRGLRPPTQPAFPPRRPVTVLAGRRGPGLVAAVVPPRVVNRWYSWQSGARPTPPALVVGHHDASLASSVPASRNPPTPKSAVLFVVTGWLDSGA